MLMNKNKIMLKTKKICETARNVIMLEAQMIERLINRVDANFVKACSYLLHCKGRIIVMGIGKSGHIARKMAATFSSTGSPAFFIHPSEAKHGDFGMITKQDVLLMISKSGETEEILGILSFVKHLNLPLITLTGNPLSTLAKASLVNIDISVEKEACPLGLAPTSSTTATLVMGDALAIALLEQRGFTANDFALSHPGGTLGRRLVLQVKEIMHKETAIPIVYEEDTLKTALVEMTQKKLGMTTVLNKEKELMGIFTDGDVRRAFDKNADVHKTLMKEIMSKNPKMIQHDKLVTEALNLMESNKITSLVVLDEKKQLAGIIHMHDILRAGLM